MKDIAWLTPAGAEMTDQEWNQEFARCLGVYLDGERREAGSAYPLEGRSFVLLTEVNHG